MLKEKLPTIPPRISAINTADVVFGGVPKPPQRRPQQLGVRPNSQRPQQLGVRPNVQLPQNIRQNTVQKQPIRRPGVQIPTQSENGLKKPQRPRGFKGPKRPIGSSLPKRPTGRPLRQQPIQTQKRPADANSRPFSLPIDSLR